MAVLSSSMEVKMKFKIEGSNCFVATFFSNFGKENEDGNYINTNLEKSSNPSLVFGNQKYLQTKKFKISKTY